ncbi:MAG: amidohydrolase family protein, partial [Myxococcota bacterium]
NTAPMLPEDLTDEVVRGMLEDGESAFAPRRGEWDAKVRLEELEADGVAGEVIFPQMVPFGASLLQFRGDAEPELSDIGNRAYNRWLAELCNSNPGRHAGVAVIGIHDIDVAVAEVRAAKAAGLWGGVLLPGTTGEQPFYHHSRYEPLWAVCEELDMPLQVHSSWSPDYGDEACATAMYITEVDMFAHRPFAALLWSGAFERHPGLKMVFTETGCSWILETLRVLEFKSADPIFKHFTKGLSLGPTEYFQRQCFIGASFMPAHEGEDRHEIGLDKLMWGSDYPHLEGTWPNTMHALNETMGAYPEDEIAALLGGNAAAVYGFDVDALQPVAERIGPELVAIRGAA